MYELPIMIWFRKKLGFLKSDEITADKAETMLKKEIELQDWKDEVSGMYLKNRGSRLNESPFTTYFLEYCQFCTNFMPSKCFTQSGNIYTEDIDRCTKLRLRIKLLKEAELIDG